MVKLLSSYLLNQLNLIMYTAKFKTILFDQTCSNSSNYFHEKHPIKFLNHHKEKIK